MKYIKRYSEKEFPPADTEEKILMQKLRYALNKFWEPKGGSVTKNRNDNFIEYKFSISVPSFLFDKNIPNYYTKIKYFVKLMKEVNAYKVYDTIDTDFNINKEQMIELISKVKYLDISINADKYNL